MNNLYSKLIKGRNRNLSFPLLWTDILIPNVFKATLAARYFKSARLERAKAILVCFHQNLYLSKQETYLVMRFPLHLKGTYSCVILCIIWLCNSKKAQLFGGWFSLELGEQLGYLNSKLMWSWHSPLKAFVYDRNLFIS